MKRLAFSKEINIAAIAIFGILISLLCRFLGMPVAVVTLPLIIALILGGLPLIFELLKNVARGEFGSDLLAGVSIVTALILGEYLAGSIVVLMLSGGTALEQYATQRAASVLRALANRMPRVAHQVIDGKINDIDLDKIQISDQIVVFPHEICPVDGVVTEGKGSMDEAYLTGEPFQIVKLPGSSVLSGAVNGESALTVTVEKLPVDSRYAKIVKIMEEAEKNRPQFRRIADRLGAWYTVVALVVAFIGWFIGGDPTRFLAVLVIATPCPLLIAIPVAIIGAISQAASRGIIVKNPAMLENIGTCETFIFDKTGTLTYGRPSLTEVIVGAEVSEDDAIRFAASLEQFSKHPLSATIRNEAEMR